MQKRLAQLAILAVVVMNAFSVNAQSQALGRPVAIDKLPSGSLYVLDAQGAVHAVDFPGGKPTITGSFRFPSGWVVSDIVSTQMGGKNILFLSFNLGLIGRVCMLSSTGQILKTWNLQNGVVGITFDSSSSTLFAASSRTPEIFRIIPSKSDGPEFIAETTGSRSLGPIIYDSKDNSLLVGDLVMGTIYRIDIATRKSTVLFGGLKSPGALKLSEDGSSLFVADAGARKVLTFPITQPGAKSKTFAIIPQFQSPSGLAWVGARLAVSDEGARKLFILSTSGNLESILPAK